LISAILEYVILAGSSLSRTKTLGRLAASLRYSLSLVDTGSSPRPRAGGRRVQLPGELRSTPALAGRATTRSWVRRGARGCAAPHTCTRTRTRLITSAHAHAHLLFHHITTDCDFACARLAPRPRSTSTKIEYVILAGSSLSRTKTLVCVVPIQYGVTAVV
jgi:hypothetical protein